MICLIADLIDEIELRTVRGKKIATRRISQAGEPLKAWNDKNRVKAIEIGGI